MTFSIAELFAQHSTDKFDLHEQHLNNQMVRMLKTIGYDRHYQYAVVQTQRIAPRPFQVSFVLWRALEP